MTTRALIQSALEGATFAATVLAWLAGFLLVLSIVALLGAAAYGASGIVRHRWHVTSTARRLRRQVG